jgi:hypothetical protein
LWDEGWFGGDPTHKDFYGRTGDLVAVPEVPSQLQWSRQPVPDLNLDGGAHGGWSADEMLVPLLALRV